MIIVIIIIMVIIYYNSQAHPHKTKNKPWKTPFIFRSCAISRKGCCNSYLSLVKRLPAFYLDKKNLQPKRFKNLKICN